MRHDAMLGNEPVRSRDRLLHRDGVRSSRLLIILGQRQQNAPPQHQRLQCGRHIADRRDNVACFGCAIDFQQRQRPLHLPVLGKPRIGRDWFVIEQFQGFPRPRFRQQRHRQVDTNHGGVGVLLKHTLEQLFALLDVPTYPQECAKIGGRADMPRRNSERVTHRRGGALQIVLPVADEADIDARIRQFGIEPQRLSEFLHRIVELIGRHVGETEHVVGLRQLRLALKRVSGRLDRSGHISQCH